MPKNVPKTSAVVIDGKDLQQLFTALKSQGYNLKGPVVRDSAIVLDEITSADELPVGWHDDQDAGRYRLTHGKDKACFDYNLGLQSWKKFLFPPTRKLWEARRDGRQFTVHPHDEVIEKQAFIGVRACEIKAMEVQDKVLTTGEHKDPFYRQRRENLFIVAVNCTRAGGTCFCASMKTGPRVESGFDLALTEITESKRHYYVAESGSEKGAEVLKEITTTEAGQPEIDRASKAVDKAAASMGRKLEMKGLKEDLDKNFDHPHWDEIADRCLTCGNCTMVCPTCFCMNVEDSTSLVGDRAERSRKMDTCFTVDFSYIHGGSIRSSESARYRQWLMHKLSYWQDQFGSFGCVGCGRCITWCPVGIDITEEAGIIRKR